MKKLNASVRKRLSKCIDGGYMSYLEESTLNLFTIEVIVKEQHASNMRVEY